MVCVLPPTKHPQYLTPVLNCIKGIVHPDIKIMSSFIHPHLIQSLYDYPSKYLLLYFAEEKCHTGLKQHAVL